MTDQREPKDALRDDLARTIAREAKAADLEASPCVAPWSLVGEKCADAILGDTALRERLAAPVKDELGIALLQEAAHAVVYGERVDTAQALADDLLAWADALGAAVPVPVESPETP